MGYKQSKQINKQQQKIQSTRKKRKDKEGLEKFGMEVIWIPTNYKDVTHLFTADYKQMGEHT